MNLKRDAVSPAPENRFERHPYLTLSATMLLLFLALIGMMEWGLRWIHPLDGGTSIEYRIPDRRFGWVLKPSVSYVYRLPEESILVSYNRDGWRDVPHTNDKPKDVLRVLVLGDSFMEAYSVRFEDSLPARLEHLTKTARRHVEVVNMGVGGYGTLQEYLVFDLLGRAYRPDVVVLAMFLGNDLAENSRVLMMGDDDLKTNARPFLDPQGPGWSVTQVDFEGAQRRYEEYWRSQEEPLRRLVRNSAVLQLGQRALIPLRRLWNPLRRLWNVSSTRPSEKDASMERRMAESLVKLDLVKFGVYYCDPPPEYLQSWDVTRRILARLNHEVSIAGARLLVMSVPAINEVDEDVMETIERNAPQPGRLCLEQASAHRRLGDLLAELNIDYLDLLPAFRDARRQTGAELFRRSDLHWNPQGHALAARELAEALENRGYFLLPAESAPGEHGQAELH